MSHLPTVQALYQAFGSGDLPQRAGRSYRDEEIHLWSFNAEGKVSRLRHYVDTAKHIKAFRG